MAIKKWIQSRILGVPDCHLKHILKIGKNICMKKNKIVMFKKFMLYFKIYMLHVFYIYTWKMEFAYMYSVAKSHKIPISTIKEGVAYFCKKPTKKPIILQTLLVCSNSLRPKRQNLFILQFC